MKVKEGNPQKVREMSIGICFDEVFFYTLPTRKRIVIPFKKRLKAITLTKVYRLLNSVTEFAEVEHMNHN
jgi:hypothetical protein